MDFDSHRERQLHIWLKLSLSELLFQLVVELLHFKLLSLLKFDAGRIEIEA